MKVWFKKEAVFIFLFIVLLLAGAVGCSYGEPATEQENESGALPNDKPASEQENESGALPEGFVYLDEVIPDAISDVRYYTGNNFLGCRVDGYMAPRVILTAEAANALADAAAELRKEGLILKIFDGYRPQRAVDHFIRWAKDLDDQKMKAQYYPDVDKQDLFRLNYIAEKSGHSRGSTVDLTLVDAKTGEELDMGSGFDFFGEISHHDTGLITTEQRQNRELLKSAMEKHGFKPYPGEWWHYTLSNEPYPDTYFDFLVE